ncbi:DUF3841 domain-containing protein [Clostridium fermenticellae]|uniref:DUF3841 domain-containing protein n=1 Tax=Clostridium fermenticellae TaxID=2068654 RepID=A0A386H6K1_9CLOT|nr:DUF3841 domain-containing protein [Clostridium fermenticellae]AYD41198.1 DUF3841 domain-containing protein [Clostridium fermenticellae]
MRSITVWTKQNENVIKELEETGRYVVKKEYILQDLGECAPLVLEAYDWLVENTLNVTKKPDDAEYPVWVSFMRQTTMLPSTGTIILELAVEPSIITSVNINKWGAILNYSYIPKDKQDAKRHHQVLEQYGVSDAKAYMSQFYPQIKREIIASWKRLFDNSILLGNSESYGNIWEVKKEWVTRIIQ